MTINLQPPINNPKFWEGFTIKEEISPFGQSFLITQTKSGKIWLLVRNKVDPSKLFPIPKGVSTNLKLKGYSWFKETVENNIQTISPLR